MSLHIKVLIAYFLLMLAVIVVLGVLVQRAADKPAWDGTYACRPGETYTIKECP